MQSRREFLDTTLKGAAGAALAGTLMSAALSTAHAAEATPLTKTKLIEILKSVGKPPEIVTNPDGTTVLLLPYGGRVLGLYAPGSEENFYWTNTALASADTARAFYASSEWQNSGGDRTWLAPEVDIFLPKFPSTESYFQPRELDPGAYKVVNENGRLKLVNRLKLKLSRSGKEINLEMSKSVAPAANPLRYEKGLDLHAVQYAGYTQFTTLELLSDHPADEPMAGLWNLVQMPHGGDLLIPTYSKAEPKIWFGQISAEDLIVGDQLVRYKMRATGEHKLGIRAVATTGRVGYLYGSGANTALIIRSFTVNPSGEYVDVPWKTPDDFGYSTQACNVNSKLGSFSELEYHIPAIGGKSGQSRCSDAAQVWAFRGKEDQIQAIARCLLSPAI
jgi:hypothetical protein